MRPPLQAPQEPRWRDPISTSIRARFTYANVVASIALFLALGGASAFAVTELAKNTVGAKQLKRNSVSASKLKDGSVVTGKLADGAVTGDKVSLSTLGKVPRAVSADTAATADRAETADRATAAESVGGQVIAKVDYRAEAGPNPTVIFDRMGLTITAACSIVGNISVTATTTKQSSSIYSFVGSDLSESDPTENDLEDRKFSTTSAFDLLAGGNGDINVVHFVYSAPDGTVASGSLAVDEGGNANGPCSAAGDVVIG
jgi:hypothetical protein